MGPTASHRLLNSFLTRRTIAHEFRRLADFFDCYQICAQCGAPCYDTECKNCLILSQCSSVFLVSNCMDFVVLSEDLWSRNCGILIVQGYISPLQQQSAESIGLVQAISFLRKMARTLDLFILFNQSIEARATVRILKSILSSNVLVSDLSELLGPKESVFAMSAKEIEQYKIYIQSAFASSS